MAAAFVGVAPNRTVRKHFEECSDCALYGLGVRLKKLYVHRDNSARIETLLDQSEKLCCIQRRRSLNPWVQRIGCDGIETLLCGQQVMASVIDVHLNFVVPDHIEVL